jgi:hypothetical protein
LVAGAGARLVLPPPAGGPSCIGGHAVRDSVQPAAQRGGLADGGGVLGQEKEGRLEGVLGVVQAAEHAVTDTQYQAAVALDERRERPLVVLPSESGQQFRVGPVLILRDGQAAQVPDGCAEWYAPHDRAP